MTTPPQIVTSYYIVEGDEEGRHDLDEALEWYLEGQDNELPRTVEVTVWRLAEPITVDCQVWVAAERPHWLQIAGLHFEPETVAGPLVENLDHERTVVDNKRTSLEQAIHALVVVSGHHPVECGLCSYRPLALILQEGELRVCDDCETETTPANPEPRRPV